MHKKIKKEYYQLLESVKDYLHYCQNIGIANLPCSDQNELSSYFSPSSFSTLNQLQDYLKNCRHCSLNSIEEGTKAETPHKKNENSCTINLNAVRGTGNSSPLLVIIGHAPTNEESLQGKPFSGERGELFTKILSSNVDLNSFCVALFDCLMGI